MRRSAGCSCQDSQTRVVGRGPRQVALLRRVPLETAVSNEVFVLTARRLGISCAVDGMADFPLRSVDRGGSRCCQPGGRCSAGTTTPGVLFLLLKTIASSRHRASTSRGQRNGIGIGCPHSNTPGRGRSRSRIELAWELSTPGRNPGHLHCENPHSVKPERLRIDRLVTWRAPAVLRAVGRATSRLSTCHHRRR